MHKSDWTAADVFKACQRLRKDVDKLGFTPISGWRNMHFLC